MTQQYVSHAVHRHVAELTARVVAKSGIPSDRYHLGKIILQCFKEDPEFVAQIDGATGESDTNQSVLKRSVECAISLRNMGLQKGDVISIMAPSHLDVGIPLYAGLYLGISVAAMDRTLSVLELKYTFSVFKPKVIFCQSERTSDVQKALNEADFKAQIITFDKGEHTGTLYFEEFLEDYGKGTAVDEFRPTDFNPAETFSLLVATSGTTELPKAAAITHKNFAITVPYLWEHFSNFPTPTRMWLLLSPVQWVTASLNFLTSPILKITRLQTSLPLNQNNIYDIINKYRPTFTIIGPSLMTSLLKPGDRERCDFTSFEVILLGGSFASQRLLQEIRKATPLTKVCNGYGMTELAGLTLDYFCGKPIGCLQYRLVNIETKKDIEEPNVHGELWLKGPGIFKGYYENDKATIETFSDDGWYMTGDLFYRDENWTFFFVERIKSLLIYKNNQIPPPQIEEVILQHPGVLNVGVTGVPDPECGDLPVACVVPKNGCTITAQEIKDLVKDTLPDLMQLRGGVIFLEELPLTSTSKISKNRLKELVLLKKRE